MNENSNSCKVMSKVLLPQDLMLHIFHLVPIHCLVNSARYVSKHWAATFNQLDRRRLRSTPGIFVENRNSFFLEFKDDVNARFETIYLPTPPNMGSIIGTCHGILMLLAPDGGHIFLANPILKCWLKLPRFPVSQKYTSVYYIMNQCTIACVPRTAKFKLFFQDVVKVSGTPSYVFYVLTVGMDNSWKEIARKQAPLDYNISWKPLYSGANDLYWITSEEIIVINVDKEIIVRQYPLPLYLSHLNLFSKHLKFLWIGTHLSCMMPKRCFRAYEIYILDFDSGKWSLYHEMGPFDYMAVCGRNLTAPDLKFLMWINDHIIFTVTLWVLRFTFIHNVKTKQFTKIEDIDVDYYEVWLHTNTLVPLSTTPA